MPVPERGCPELAVGARRRGNGRGHRREPMGDEVVVRRDDFGLGERRAGEDEGGGKKETREIGHMRTHRRGSWTKLRRSLAGIQTPAKLSSVRGRTGRG